MPESYNSIATRVWESLDQIVQTVRGTHAEHRANIPLLTRLTAHLGIIALTIIALLLSGIEIRAAGPPTGQTQESDNGLGPIQPSDQADSNNLFISAVPITVQNKPVRRDVVQYLVQPGDTVSGIAAHFHISPDSILWANAKLEDNPDQLSLGQTLNIPPVSGVLYTVVKGDTVNAIAARFKGNPQDIVADPFNQSNHDFKSNPPQLTLGAFIMVPNGEKPVVVKKVVVRATVPTGAAKGTSNFIWPTSACVSQNFWLRHPGIDLATPKGTPVRAADSGFVEFVGWDNTGYGNMILINHGNGYVTRYAHLSAFNVVPGDSVKKGDLIGRVGSTGHSTGPHLHFEVIFQGVHRNPSFFMTGTAPRQCYR
jgi:murein DD-endopeptidase MepM/ murein hydrolase activator NlpD